MSDGVITTGVDELLEYLKGKDKVAMQDVSKVLSIQQETLQAWVDFLVEEKILGIEYKFTKPFIYLNKEDTKKAKIIEQTEVEIDDVKREFEERAKRKQIPEEKIKDLWKSHVIDALERKRDYFIEQAQRRHVADPIALWQKYRANLVART